MATSTDTTATVEQFETMPLDKIRELANAELRKAIEESQQEQAESEEQQEEKPQQKRDEKGQFAKADDQQEEETTAEVEAEAKPEVKAEVKPEVKQSTFSTGPIKYRRVVKGVDGGQDEVFEADSPEALADKLVASKEHATRKIREQEAELRKHREQTKTADADQEFVYSQELLKNPTAAIKKLFKETTGYDISEFKTVAERSRALDEKERFKTVATNFLTSHPDYEDTPRNFALMQNERGNEVSEESFEKAYRNLKSRGFLDLKSEEAHADTQQQAEDTERIVQPKVDAAQQRTKKSSGLSTHSRPVAVPVNQEPSEDDLYDPSKYSLDEIKRRANAQLAKSR